MTIKTGSILRIKDYVFEDDGSTRDKYSIVLYANDQEAYILHSLTTTQNKKIVPSEKYGCSIYQNSFPYYFIPSEQIIGNEGFYFEKDTYIFFKENVRKERIEKFQQLSEKRFGIISLGVLSNEELKRIIKCALKSKFIPLGLIKALTALKEKL
jgi:hypothetical protein